MRKKLFFALMILCSVSGWAQSEKQMELLRQQEQRRKAELMRQLDSGVYLMDHGNFIAAEEKFLYVLQNVSSVPSDLTFYFGKNSFYLNKYKQSVDWLNKYIQLKGTGGQHFNEATDILQRAEKKLMEERAVQNLKAQEVFSTSFEIDCGPSGKVVCPVCKGDHVIIKPGRFGNEYKTCPYCNEHGILSCKEYNMLLRGELQQKR